MMLLGCDVKVEDNLTSNDIASDVFLGDSQLVVKESGGTFKEQAKSILIISSLLEDSSSFYSEITRCKEQKEKSEHCEEFIKVTSQSINTFLSDRDKKDLQEFVINAKRLSEVD